MSKEKIFDEPPNPDNETEEEKIIKSLVDDIYEYEEKILEINSILEQSTNQSNYDENLIILKKKENELRDKINLIKIKENDEINKKKNLINVKQNILNNIDNQLNEYINKLTTFNTLSFSSLIMTKYIISNNINEFLTKEQIDDIINNSGHFSQNNNINNVEKELNNNLENEINEDINAIKDKINQINENLSMMKEEKKMVNNEIIELISCKETIDSLVKTSLINLNALNDLNNKNEEIEENEYNIDENNNIILPEIYSYELSLLDTNKVSRNICDELYDLFNIKNNEIINMKTNINNNKINNKNIINNNEYNDIDQYNKELSLNISAIKPRNNDEDNFNKNNLEVLIKSELDTFLLNEIKNKDIINNLLDNLCIIISTKLQLLDVDDISSEKLKIYLLYYLKSVYYDNIIENKLKFINKEYKILKKEGKKKLESLKNELNILENKKEEIISNKKNEKVKNNFLNNNNNKRNNGSINLTQSEQEYIQICSKGNSLLKQKEELINIINNLEKSIEKIKNENNEEINKISIELNEIIEKINSLTNNEEKTKIKLNDDILNYRKIISDKFDLIKKQLQKYKSKYGSNIGIYNRLLDGINDTIKQTYNKYPYEENSNIDNFDLEINNNINNMNNINENVNIYKKDSMNKIINSLEIKDNEKYNNNNYISNNINNNLINKLIPLTKNTICYFREIRNNSNKFNPISDNISVETLTQSPYNFIKSMIVLNHSYDSISLISSNYNYNYTLNQIDNTIMNSNLKIIIEIHRDYRKYKNSNKNKPEIKDFIKKEKLKYFNYDNKFIEKCALNKFYNFSLLLNESKRIEIVLCSYEDFKLWINGFAFIIKNKSQIIKVNNNFK